MPMAALRGHARTRARLAAALDAGTLPAALLLTGPPGVGKQRLALWLAQALLCTGRAGAPCGACAGCHAAAGLRHPDLYWFFPRPRLKDADATPDEVLGDYAEAARERLARNGLYPRSSGAEGLHVATVRAVVRQAALAPAMGARKVFVVADAERMVAQEGADQAANAFLKLLEEPPADTVLVLTSSAPGALLPTIRSRVVPLRLAALADAEVREFVEDPLVAPVLDALGLPAGSDRRVALAHGAPGALLNGESRQAAREGAARLLRAASAGAAARYEAALAQGGAGARGAFAATLAELTRSLHERAVAATDAGDRDGARRASVVVGAVSDAQARADGNVNPQLVAAALLRELAGPAS